MTVNYADKFSPKVAESFKHQSFTNNAVNHDYDFIGVKTIKVFNVETAAMGNYGRTGSTRYGSASNLGNGKKEYTVEVDRAFTFTIDKMDNEETMGIFNPGRALQRQIEQRVVPEVDKYRIAKIIDDKNKIDKNVAITDKNAYSEFLDAVTTLMDKEIPMAGCYAYISTNFYKQIRKDPMFIKPCDMAQEMLVKGVVGMIEGIPLIHVPAAYFPTSDGLVGGNNGITNLTNLTTLLASGKKIEFMLMNKEAVLGAERLTDYKVHDNPPGINGWLVEGRMVYDCFVLENKKDMIYIHANK